METKKLSFMLHSTVETRDKLLLSRLDLSELIETNFATVPKDSNLKDLVKIISNSSRNIFPVLDKEFNLVGLIYLDKIRNIIFDISKYETLMVTQLMEKPAGIVELDENLFEVLSKFDTTKQWNLPVVENDRYLVFYPNPQF